MGKLIFDYVSNADMYWITDENGIFKASVNCFDDAKRLCASFNACEGIQIEKIEETVYLQNGWSAATLEIAEKANGYQLENERLKSVKAQMLGALQDAEIQIEYLHEKFKPTGSGNKTLALIRSAISAATNK